jgi:hypothetical protein
MTGDVVTGVLAIGPGAQMNGNISMGTDVAPKGKKRAAETPEE